MFLKIPGDTGQKGEIGKKKKFLDNFGRFIN